VLAGGGGCTAILPLTAWMVSPPSFLSAMRRTAVSPPLPMTLSLNITRASALTTSSASTVILRSAVGQRGGVLGCKIQDVEGAAGVRCQVPGRVAGAMLC